MTQSVIAIGAHPDDIELGCGATLAKHVVAGDRVTMLVITRGEVGPGDTCRRIREQQLAAETLGVHELRWGEEIPDCQVSLHELKVVHLIERAIQATGATTVYTHSASDSHQDHRAVALCTMGAARQVPTVMSYGAPSALQFQPTHYVDVSDALDKKIEALMCHATQVEASEMVSPSRVRSTAEHYGHLCRRPYAEGFEPVRVVMQP